MNEHTIRGISEVAHEADRAFRTVALGHTVPDFDNLSDDDMDAVVEFTRDTLVKLSQNPNYAGNGPTEKVKVAVIRTLAANPNLV